MCLAVRPFRLQPPDCSHDRFDTLPLSVMSVRQCRIRASPQEGRLARQTGRIEFTQSYGLVILLQLLPTPPHGDAVTFRYRPESVYLKRTHTSLTKHTHKRTIGCSSAADFSTGAGLTGSSPTCHLIPSDGRSRQNAFNGHGRSLLG